MQVKISFSQITPPALQQFTTQAAMNGFVENKGQEKNKDVLLSASGKGLKLFVTTRGLTYVLNKKRISKNETEKAIDSLVRVDVDFLQAQIDASKIIFDKKKNDAAINFYNAENPKGIFGLNEYKKVTIKNIYPGIDWVLYATDSSLKYNFEIGANANFNDIKLQYKGVEKLYLGMDGSLHAHTKIGDIIESAPHSFQTSMEIRSNFILDNNHIISFNIKNQKPNQAFTIDPNIVWTTVFGGTSSDELMSVTHDKFDNFLLQVVQHQSIFQFKMLVVIIRLITMAVMM